MHRQFQMLHNVNLFIRFHKSQPTPSVRVLQTREREKKQQQQTPCEPMQMRKEQQHKYLFGCQIIIYDDINHLGDAWWWWWRRRCYFMANKLNHIAFRRTHTLWLTPSSCFSLYLFLFVLFMCV